MLGAFADGSPALLAIVSDDHVADFVEPVDWQSVRRVTHGLDPDDAAAAVAAVSLSRWLTDASFCPACGERADVEDGGWSRRCASCGRQHFPRTDPAVIVAVTSATDPDRLLLGNNTLWEPNRFSCFAGFVEAGESAEDAVRRELREECGIRVHTMRYRGSQAWPFPRSFMLGFLADGIDDNDARADGEEIRTVRWFTRDELRAAFRGDSDIVLPGAASISHALIRGWCDGE
ncbi:NAD(+) diphosphatase [Microbacterium sp. C7(2022)]|uniref:NAD(+) diphosphatase n=1 Tax=Microbacterium sp. C7(2022) TaxID=2992759 RepID=UPI00237AE7C6|nr:NAD(+) diphosphatase [Microbacterium sp. C7(2022)]